MLPPERAMISMPPASPIRSIPRRASCKRNTTRCRCNRATRNGYYFTIDRTTGEHLVTSKWGEFTNWATGLNKFGGPKVNTEKDATVGGSRVSPSSDGTINWEPPAYSPETGLLYVSEHNS